MADLNAASLGPLSRMVRLKQFVRENELKLSTKKLTAADLWLKIQLLAMDNEGALWPPPDWKGHVAVAPPNMPLPNEESNLQVRAAAITPHSSGCTTLRCLLHLMKRSHIHLTHPPHSDTTSRTCKRLTPSPRDFQV